MEYQQASKELELSVEQCAMICQHYGWTEEELIHRHQQAQRTASLAPKPELQLVPKRPLSSIVQKTVAETQRRRAQNQAQYLEAAKPVCKRYGLDCVRDEKHVRSLLGALEQQERCANCRLLSYDCKGAWISPEGKVETTPCPNILKEKVAETLPAIYASKTFGDYEETADNRRALAMAKWLFTEEYDGHSVYFYGGFGTGKTFLATLIAKGMILRGQTVEFGCVPDLLDEMKKAFNDPTTSSQAVFERFIKCDLLILDDIGVGLMTPWNVNVICQLINKRYESKKLIVYTSNYSPSELKERFSRADAMTAGRIYSRMVETTYAESLGTHDRRCST